MLTKASVSLTNRLVSAGIVKSEDFEVYLFGIENTILKLIHMVSYVTLGIMLGKLPELVVFLAAFIPLREYSGGFHAKTPLRCYIVSCFTVFTVLFILRVVPDAMLNYSIPISLVGSLLLFLVIPVEAKEKPLDESEKIYYKSKGGFLILLILVLTLVFIILDWDKIAFILSLSLAYEMFIALVGKYIKSKD